MSPELGVCCGSQPLHSPLYPFADLQSGGWPRSLAGQQLHALAPARPLSTARCSHPPGRRGSAPSCVAAPLEAEAGLPRLPHSWTWDRTRTELSIGSWLVVGRSVCRGVTVSKVQGGSGTRQLFTRCMCLEDNLVLGWGVINHTVGQKGGPDPTWAGST